MALQQRQRPHKGFGLGLGFGSGFGSGKGRNFCSFEANTKAPTAMPTSPNIKYSCFILRKFYAYQSSFQKVIMNRQQVTF